MIDIFLTKLTSRKFLVLILATILLFLKIINQTTWLAIAIIYVSVEGIPDAVERILKIIFNKDG